MFHLESELQVFLNKLTFLELAFKYCAKVTPYFIIFLFENRDLGVYMY